jgi:hypothetical protein
MTYPIIDVWHGNEVQLQWRGATEKDGIAFSLQGASALLLLKERLTDPDESAVLTQTTENRKITITDPGNGILVATITGEDSEGLESSSNGCPHRDYFSQFAVRLSTGQIVRSANFILRFNRGAIAAMPPLP